MTRLRFLFLFPSLWACSSPLNADENKQPKPSVKFTVGKDTTRITGPLDKDGFVDYEAALNKHLGKGITPDRNAFADLGPDK